MEQAHCARASGRDHLRAVEPPDEAAELREIDAAIQESEDSNETHFSQTLLPDGAIVAVEFIDVEVGVLSQRPRWFAHFRITDTLPVASELVGKPLLRAYNAPQRPFLSQNHNLSLDWKNVTGLQPRALPLKRRPRVILGTFLRGCQVRARTSVVARRMNFERKRWEETPPETHYSVISALLGVATGTPRVLQRRQQR